jgi:cbb3-type cytochrome oxidase subunit 3
MKKEFNGETWLLLFLIVISLCSYFYLYQKRSNERTTALSQLEVLIPVKDENLNSKEPEISKSTEFIDQKIIKKTLEKIKEWLPVN